MALVLTPEHLELRKRDEPKLGGIFGPGDWPLVTRTLTADPCLKPGGADTQAECGLPG